MTAHFEQIDFLSQRPQWIQICHCLDQRTGLTLQPLLISESPALIIRQLTNPWQAVDSVDVYWAEDPYIYLCWSGSASYLVGALLYTLKDLGGVVGVNLPAWSWARWSLVCDYFLKPPHQKRSDSCVG